MAVISNIRELLLRPVAWGAVLLSYIGVFAALCLGTKVVTDNHRRAADICTVVRNVNINARFRARTEQESLRSTRQWLYDHRYEAQAEQDELTRRVRENLPVVERRYHDAARNVAATEPPKSCEKGQ